MEFSKVITCIICNERIFNQVKHICSYRTNSSIHIYKK